MKFEITFRDEFTSESLGDCCDDLLCYLRECVASEDVCAFNFVKLPNEEIGSDSSFKEVKILQKVDGKWIDLNLNDDLTEQFEQILDRHELVTELGLLP
tara:strand:- start:219 stop:515 length:297 start_codon:yes stop_codon:yes gene_type:complete